MKNSSRFRVLLLVILAGLIGYSIGATKISWQWKNFNPEVKIVNGEPPPSVSTSNYEQFWTVMKKLSNSYYDKTAIDGAKFLDGAIEGMVNSLDDPYTVYLPPVRNSDFKQGLAGKFEGIGAELGVKGKQIIVVAPLDGSPAEKAGVKAGDAILKVDSDFTTGWSLSKTVDRIRGEKGTTVLLTVLHKAEQEPKEIKIVRDTITVKSVTSWIKKVKDINGIKKDKLRSGQDKEIVYIRLSQFGDETNKEWQSIAASVDRKMRVDHEIAGVVLDLRNNPGGYLSDAVYILSEFINKGVAVAQEDRNGERTVYPVRGNGLLPDVPLIVLINRGSASASEIVAGAIVDHKRGVLVGETSFGKGTIQQAEDLGGGAGLHVTIAKWLTPDGRWIHQKGLMPDIKVDLDQKDPSRDTQLERAIVELINK